MRRRPGKDSRSTCSAGLPASPNGRDRSCAAVTRACGSAGADSPPLGFDQDPAAIEAVRDRLAAAAPDIVYVGLGFPKQERLIARLAPGSPDAWFIGCGAAIPYAAGALPRPPAWMRRAGLAWLFRLISEPRRLFKRYLVQDLPFAVALLASAAAGRFR